MNRVLIVEDEKLLRDAFAYLFKSQGFVVGQAENGKLALAQLPVFRPDMLLLDVLMPVMNGQQFLEVAQLPVQYPKLRTLLLSNLSDPLTLDDIKRYGVDDLVLKADLSPHDLLKKVRKMLAGNP